MPSFGKRGGESPSPNRERLGTRSLTHNDIQAHVDGRAVYNDLHRPDVQDLLARWQQTGIDTVHGDSAIRDQILREINERLGRDPR